MSWRGQENGPKAEKDKTERAATGLDKKSEMLSKQQPLESGRDVLFFTPAKSCKHVL